MIVLAILGFAFLFVVATVAGLFALADIEPSERERLAWRGYREYP